MTAALSFEDVRYSYPRARLPALDGIGFDLQAGEFCVVAGASACGKSTLLRAANGLVPHFHGGRFAGRVEVAGMDTREHGPESLAGVAGSLFQDPETQIVCATVGAELALGLENRGFEPPAVARGVEEVALALGIEGLLERATAELSGGERQRVALGAALAGRPQLVVLDEPTSQLDPVAGDELIWLLRRLNEEWGTTVLLAEHRLERCLSAADRVLALDAGVLAFDGRPSDFLAWAQDAAPELQTPAARLFGAAGLAPPPTGVKQARAALAAAGLEPPPGQRPAPPRSRRRRRPRDARCALAFSGVWHELRDGPVLLRGVDLTLEPGERVALMGRNGAGKSTLLRHAKGLLEPTRGRISRNGPVALLLQNPGDYFLHDRVGAEAGAAELADAGLTAVSERHPRDLSGGERQRLALAIVTSTQHPAVVALDEPTRGMDRRSKSALASLLEVHAARGSAVVVATHDVEFAAELATRVVLMAAGRVIADAPAAEILSGGWYFATETARVLGGEGEALLPDEGAVLLRARIATGAAEAVGT